ncbi:MAG: antitoxin [Coriobacteriia bacterium]|nr:MAG: antitoxin [Coriobacteriia bacterium]
MAQLSLYMDEVTMAGLREDATKRGISISAYAREVLETRNARDAAGWENGWPPGFFDLYGSCPDFPEIEDLESTPVEPLFV